MCLFCDSKVRMWCFEDKKQSWVLCFYNHGSSCSDSSFTVGIFIHAGKNSDTLRIFSGQEQNLTFDIPVSGTVYNADQEAVMEFPVTDQVTLFARESQSYQMRLKLFGVVPIRDVEVRVTGERTLIPVGMPVGIYMKAKSAMVIGVGEFIGEDGMKYAPSRYLLQEGDYILQVNGQEIGGKRT